MKLILRKNEQGYHVAFVGGVEDGDLLDLESGTTSWFGEATQKKYCYTRHRQVALQAIATYREHLKLKRLRESTETIHAA